MALRHSWLNPKVEARKSEKHGKGAFARESIYKGERLAILGGDIMWIDEINNLPEALSDYPMQIEERFVLGSRDSLEPEDTDFFNHSCNPNIGFKGQIFLVAMRDIKTDEELTFDYAMVVSESVGSDIVFKMECTCGSENCRKTITEYDWTLPQLQKRYKGYFSEYIKEKIRDRHKIRQ
jgi:hypothetical protein